MVIQLARLERSTHTAVHRDKQFQKSSVGVPTAADTTAEDPKMMASPEIPSEGSIKEEFSTQVTHLIQYETAVTVCFLLYFYSLDTKQSHYSSPCYIFERQFFSQLFLCNILKIYLQMNLLDVDSQDDDNGPEAVVEGMFGAQMTQYQ